MFNQSSIAQENEGNDKNTPKNVPYKVKFNVSFNEKTEIKRKFIFSYDMAEKEKSFQKSMRRIDNKPAYE